MTGAEVGIAGRNTCASAPARGFSGVAEPVACGATGSQREKAMHLGILALLLIDIFWWLRR